MNKRTSALIMGILLGSVQLDSIKAIQLQKEQIQLAEVSADAKRRGSNRGCSSDSSADEYRIKKHKKKLHNKINSATQANKLFVDKSSSFFTSTPCQIEETNECRRKSRNRLPSRRSSKSCKKSYKKRRSNSHKSRSSKKCCIKRKRTSPKCLPKKCKSVSKSSKKCKLVIKSCKSNSSSESDKQSKKSKKCRKQKKCRKSSKSSRKSCRKSFSCGKGIFASHTASTPTTVPVSGPVGENSNQAIVGENSNLTTVATVPKV